MRINIQKFNICVGLIIVLSIQGITCQNQNLNITEFNGSCIYQGMQFVSSSVIPFSLIQHISDDKSSVYETELDESDNYQLSGYKVKFRNATNSVNSQVQEFNIQIPISFQIAYVSSEGGCVIVDNKTQLVAYETNSYSFVERQRFNYLGQKTLKASEDCNLISIVNTLGVPSIFINSNQQNIVIPDQATVFDKTFTWALDSSNNLYLNYIKVQTFEQGNNLGIPLEVIYKPASSLVILYSRNGDGDYALVLFNVYEYNIKFEKKWDAFSLTGNKILKVNWGDSFTSLIFKDDNGIVQMVSVVGSAITSIAIKVPADNQKFANDALISFSGDQVFSYLNKKVNVFNIFVDQIWYLGSYDDVDPILKAGTIASPSGSLHKNNLKILDYIGLIACPNDQNSTDNQTNGGNQTNNETTNNETENQTTDGNGTTNNETTGNETDNQTTDGNGTNNETTGNETNNQTDVEDEDFTNAIEILTQNNGNDITVTDDEGNVLLCPAGCVCSDGETCTSCLPLFSLDDSKQCILCIDCLTCDPTNPSICLTCLLPYQLNKITKQCYSVICANQECQTCSEGGQCLTCFQKFSLVDGKCVACPQLCSACEVNQTECDVDSCDQGYVFFENTETNKSQCISCTIGCLQCESSDINNCTGCLPGYYSSENPVSSINQCLACIQNCDTCNDSTKCNNCADGYALTSTKDKCVLQCSSNCLTCQQNLPDNCLSCFYGMKLDSETKQCIQDMICNQTGSCRSCARGFVLNDNICLACEISDTNCTHCSRNDPTQCANCRAGFYLDSSENKCEICPTNCTLCLSANTCIKCSDGSFLERQHRRSTGKCAACESPCLTCHRKKGNCQSCIQGYTLNGRFCIAPQNLQSQLEIDVPHSESIIIIGSFQEINYDVCTLFKKRKSRNTCLALFRTRPGSTIISSGVNAESEETVAQMEDALQERFTEGNQLQGYRIISSSVKANGLTDSFSTNLGLILGVSIPLFIIIAVALVYLAVRKKKDEDLKQGSQVAKESQNNIYPSSQNYTQKI